MILEIKYWPNPCLKKIAAEIEEPDIEACEQIIEDLFETMYAGSGLGLAAPQCDIPLRILVMDSTQLGGQIKQGFINPVIKETTEKTIFSEEGCLSFPGAFAVVLRYDGVVVENTTLTGETEEVILNGVDAVCFQHELDHLNGIVFFDHLKPAKRQMMETRVRKNVKKIERKRK